MQAPVVFQSVSKRFPDGTLALDDVSFELAPAQFCVVLGPSGSGKSTLLRMVNGLVDPSAGDVVVAGLRLAGKGLKAARRKVGMVYQHFNLVERASVAHNLISGALPEISTFRALLGLHPARFRARACELAAAAGLDPSHLPRRVSELSGGQQQRVGIARALMLDPEILLADEPVASLDPRISFEIMTLLRDSARLRGAAVLCSLHQVDLAIGFADRVIALNGGRIVFDGPASSVTQETFSLIYAGNNADGRGSAQ